jgi:formylglycine-generating enzyme
MANTWAGEFSWQDLKPRGWGTTPVGSFPPNGYGLSDMTGKMWEGTADFYTADRTGTWSTPAASRAIPTSTRPRRRPARGPVRTSRTE